MKKREDIKEITDIKEVSTILDVSIDDLNEILEEIRPYMVMDGGDVRVVKMTGTVVGVNLKGACDGCCHAEMTLKHGVEELLKEKVHPNIEVKVA